MFFKNVKDSTNASPVLRHKSYFYFFNLCSFYILSCLYRDYIEKSKTNLKMYIKITNIYYTQ